LGNAFDLSCMALPLAHSRMIVNGTKDPVGTALELVSNHVRDNKGEIADFRDFLKLLGETAVDDVAFVFDIETIGIRKDKEVRNLGNHTEKESIQ